MTFREKAGNALNSKRLWLAVVLGSVTIVLWYYAFNDGEIEETRQIDDSEPDAYALQASYLNFNVDGTLQSRLEAVRTDQYVDSDIGVLTQPRLDVYEEKGKRNFWHMSSNSGLYDSRKSVLTLDENVEILGSTLDGLPVRILTSALVYRLGDKFVETNNAVEVVSGSDRIEGTGMELDMLNKAIQLKQDVRATYQASPSSRNN